MSQSSILLVVSLILHVNFLEMVIICIALWKFSVYCICLLWFLLISQLCSVHSLSSTCPFIASLTSISLQTALYTIVNWEHQLLSWPC